MKPKKLMLVVAGTWQQFQDWLRVKGIKPEAAKYVSRPSDVRGGGYTRDNAELVFVGQVFKNPFYQSPEMRELVARGMTMRRES